MVTAVPPVPVEPPVLTVPPVPVEPPMLVPPVPDLPAMPPVPVEPPVALPPVPVEPPVPVVTVSTQALLAQCWVEPQAFPQVPQFVELVGELQAPSEHLVPEEQVDEQVPSLLQTSVPEQALQLEPQCWAFEATQAPLQLNMPDGHLHVLSWQVCPPEQGLPQTPQLLESLAVFTHAEPQGVSGELQVTPVPPVPLPPVPLLPPVPGLPPGALVQAAVRIAKPSPKSHARAVVVIATYIPGETKLAFRAENFIANGPAANSTNSSRKWRLLSLLAVASAMRGRGADLS